MVDARRSWVAPSVGLALLVLLAPLRAAWPVQAVLGILVLTLPGIVLLRALGIGASVRAANPALVPATSVALLMLVGVGVNVVGPAVGVDEPLRTVPLLVGLVAVCAGLIVIGRRSDTDPVSHAGASVAAPGVWLPMLLPVLAAVGALQLNNGWPPVVAWVAVLGVVAALVAIAIRADRAPEPEIRSTIYCCSLAGLWSISLRSDYVFGWDIVTEFRKAQEVIANGYWTVDHTGDAYGALLSITILPAQLHELAGVSAVVAFKAVFPMIFAFFGVAVYAAARNLVTARWAVVAVILVLAQRSFALQMPGLARQEVALLLFALLLWAIVNEGLSRSRQLMLVVLLGVSVVLAHYSTTYLAIGLLSMALFFAVLACRRHLRSAPLVALGVAAGTLIVTSALWYGPITNSSSNVDETAGSLRSNGLSFLPNLRPGSGLLQGFVFGNAPEPVTAAEYASLAADDVAKNHPYVVPIPESNEARYALQDVPPISEPSAPNAVISVGSLLLQQLLYLTSALGAAWLLFGPSAQRTVAHRILGAVGLAGIGVLAALRVSGTLATAYNQERALLQILVPLSIAAVWLLYSIDLRRPQVGRVLRRVTIACLAVLIVNACGLVSTLTGSGQSVALANQGEDYERFYVYEREITSSSWLGEHARPGELVYADRYGSLRYLLTTGRGSGLMQALTPRTIDQHAWVYASAVNGGSGRTRAYLDGKSIQHEFPFPFLADNYNQVYSNGESSIYHR